MKMPFAALVAAALLAAPRAAEAGYTHSWTWHRAPDEAALARCVDEMRKIAHSRFLHLSGVMEEGHGEGTTPRGHVEVDFAFSGWGPDARAGFSFPGYDGFNSCKPQAESYDAIVLACLLVARDHFPPDVLEIESDASWEEGAWRRGTTLYLQVLQREPRNPVAPAGAATALPPPRWWAALALALLVGGAGVTLAIRTARRGNYTSP